MNKWFPKNIILKESKIHFNKINGLNNLLADINICCLLKKFYCIACIFVSLELVVSNVSIAIYNNCNQCQLSAFHPSKYTRFRFTYKSLNSV